MKRTAKIIEENKSANASPEITHENKPKDKRGCVERIKAWQWKPGQSGNPGGRPKNDVAAAICRAAFENNADVIYKGVSRELIAGKAYTFLVAAERAYGKLKESKEVTHIYQETPDADLNKRIADLERELGLAAAIDEAGRVGLAAAGEVKTNGHAKDTDILSR